MEASKFPFFIISRMEIQSVSNRFLHKFTTGESPSDVTFQIAPEENTGDTVRADTITCFGMSLDDLIRLDN